MTQRDYFWWKTKWFWTHRVWYVLLLVFFMQSFFIWSKFTEGYWLLGLTLVSGLMMGFVGSSTMIAIDFSRDHRREENGGR